MPSVLIARRACLRERATSLCPYLEGSSNAADGHAPFRHSHKVASTAASHGVTIRGEWAAVDQSRNYTLLEAPDVETVERMQAPFVPYVEMEIVPVVAFSGWTAS